MKTRHTSPLTVTAPAPRNPFVAAARTRKAGSHRLQGGSRRQQAQRELQHLLRREALSSASPHRHSP